MRDRERRADAVVSSALDWIGRQSGKWFVWVHVYDPHVTYDPPAEWKTRFPADPYLGEVSWTDSALGVLFDRLSAQPRPTLTIVTADHGEGLGDHGELTHGVFAYESVLKVPLIVGEIGSSRRAASPNGRDGREPRAARRPPADDAGGVGCRPGRHAAGNVAARGHRGTRVPTDRRTSKR